MASCDLSLPSLVFTSNLNENRYRYSVIQWQCLLLVFVTTAAFYEIRVFEERQFATISQGLPLFLATLTFTSIGAVYSEKCIKAGGDVPFYYQKVPQ